MKDSIFPIIIVFLVVDTLALLSLLIYKILKEYRRHKIRHFGDWAEEVVAETIREEFPGSILLNNIFLKTPHGSTQLDHILLCKWGIFVIETKSHNGKINIGKKEWVQIYGDKVVHFHSPLLQNQIHVKALEQTLKKHRALAKMKVSGIVVFTSKKVSFSKRPEGVLRLHELSPYIKSGGQSTNRRELLTARPGRRYLTRQKMEAVEKAIRKNSVKSSRKQNLHEKKVRNLDRRKRV